MIVTVTFNPSIDYLYNISHFELGRQNRFKEPFIMIGGKGINAGRVASQLSANVHVTGTLAGDTGKFAYKKLKREEFGKDFIRVKGRTRNAITIMHDEGIQTEIVEEGPKISQKNAEDILEKIIQKYRSEEDLNVVVLSGSANSGDPNFYAKLIRDIQDATNGEVKVLVDISKEQLKNALSFSNPYFIKPNIHELEELLGMKIEGKEMVKQILELSIFSGVELIIVSLGEDGGIAKYDGDIYELKVPKVEYINPTGSGDATVGGVAYSLDKNLGIEETLKYAMACGVANSLEKAVGYVSLENVIKLLPLIEIIRQ